jgi:hypothetical protein
VTPRVRFPAAALLAALALVGCGSTVQYQGSATAGTTGDGLSTTDGAGPATGITGDLGADGSTSGGSATTGMDAGPGSGPRQGGAPTAATTGTGGAPGSSIRSGPESGRGFTKTTLAIGVGTADDYNAFAGSFGLQGVGYSGDPNAWLKAVTDDINKRGGLLGRRIVLVKHNYNTAQTLNDPAGANQAACTTWTQDTPVFAVLLAGLVVEDTLLSCLAQVGTPLVYPGASLDYPLHYQGAYAKYPLFFNLAQMVGERYDRLSVARLVARSFFQPWNAAAGRPGTAAANPTKVGLIGFDDRDGVIQEESRKRELARHGLRTDSTIRCPRALTGKIQCEQSAVLRFASSGITHVFGADTIFMNNAQSQGYHPRYFVSTTAAAFAANVGANQLTGAMGEGYVPVYDVEARDYPGDPSPATARCKGLMKAIGQSATDNSTLALQLSICEEFFFTKAALDGAGALSALALRRGMEGLGARQASTLTFRTFLSAREHASAVVLRDLAYRADLGRFVYASRTDHGDLS